MTPPEKKDALGNVVLMLTTIDRKNGQKLVSVVQYEEVKGEYFLTAPRSSPAEWKRNIHANPWVVAQVKARKIHALAEPVKH